MIAPNAYSCFIKFEQIRTAHRRAAEAELASPPYAFDCRVIFCRASHSARTARIGASLYRELGENRAHCYRITFHGSERQNAFILCQSILQLFSGPLESGNGQEIDLTNHNSGPTWQIGVKVAFFPPLPYHESERGLDWPCKSTRLFDLNLRVSFLLLRVSLLAKATILAPQF